MRQKQQIQRAINADGTNAEFENIIKKHEPIAVIEFNKKSDHYILLFRNVGKLTPKVLFTQVSKTDFNAIIKKHKRVYSWWHSVRRKVKYTGYKTFIPDYQKRITVEFGLPMLN